MKLKDLFFFLLVLAGNMFSSCDSANSVKDPNLTRFIKYYGGDGDQTGDDMVVLADGSMILFGTTKPSGTGKFSQWYLVRSDAKGMIIWERKFGGPFDEKAKDIELTANNQLVLVGNSNKTTTDSDVLIMTLTLDGVKIDSALVGLKNLGGLDTDEDAISVSITSDGYMVAGSTSNTDLKPNAVANDQRDAMHLRFFNNLTLYPISWGKGTGPGTVDAAIKVIQVSANQFYVFGYSNKVATGHPNPDINFWIFGLGSTGLPNTADLFVGSTTDDDKLSSISTTPPQSGEGYFLGGITYGQSGASDIYVAKLRKDLSFSPSDAPFSKPLSIKLGTNLSEKTAVFASQQSGFFVLTNENSFNNNQNWLLTKVGNDGSVAWNLPIVFGGEGLDNCGAVQELPDGRIALIGTMRTGKPDVGEMKMTLIKVNQDGKLEN